MSLLEQVVGPFLERMPHSKVIIGLTNSGNTLSNLGYSLRGSFSFEEVLALNNMIHPSFPTYFGYTSQDKPIAIIGVPGKEKEIQAFLDVWQYGSPRPKEPINFCRINETSASAIKNFYVFGDLGLDSLKEKVKFDKISIIYDTRMRIKNSTSYRIIEMDYKFAGTYSYAFVQSLLSDSAFHYMPHAIYGKVGKKNVAIIGLKETDIDQIAGFRDVWEYGAPAPEKQNFKPLNDADAVHTNDFTIYGYSCFLLPTDKYPIEKIDRTLDERFDFLSSGKDYRLT